MQKELVKSALLSVFNREELCDMAFEQLYIRDSEFAKMADSVSDFSTILDDYVSDVYDSDNEEKKMLLVRLALDFINLETGGASVVLEQEYERRYTEIETTQPCLVAIEELMIENEACLVRLKERG